MTSILMKTCLSPLTTLPIFLLLLLLCSRSFLIKGHPLPIKKGTGPVVPAVLIFGDSIVDTGNNNHLETLVKADFLPYGGDFPGHVPTGRFSNGKITSDFIVSNLGVKEIMPAYLEPDLKPNDLLTGVSFASAGTGFHPLTSTIAMVIPMEKQLDMFKEYKKKISNIAGDEKAAKIVDESLYIVFSGSNDVIQYFFDPFRLINMRISDYSELLVRHASTFLQGLANLGARKIGVFGVPPIGCAPFQRSLDGFSRNCIDNRNELSQTYNGKLVKELETLNSKLNGTRLVFIDIYSTLLDLMQNPQKYGFKESKRSCCGTGTVEVSYLCNRWSQLCNASEYIFFDSYHPTERASKVLVNEIIEKYLPVLL